MTPDRVAGWVVGAGIGSAVSIITWVVASRLTDLWLTVPLGPIVAFASALIAGTGVALERGMSLSRSMANSANKSEIETEAKS